MCEPPARAAGRTPAPRGAGHVLEAPTAAGPDAGIRACHTLSQPHAPPVGQAPHSPCAPPNTEFLALRRPRGARCTCAAKLWRMVLVSLLLAAAVQADPPPTGPAQTEPASVPTVVFTDAEARKAIAEFKAVPAKAPLADRVAAVDALVRGRHEDLVPILDKVVRRDPSMAVRRKAAEALAWQPAKRAYPVVTALLASTEVTSSVELIGPLVATLARVGYRAQDWARLETFFRAGYGQDRTALQREIILLAAEHKEKQAVAVLLENFDEPIPEDIHGAANPPAEYWEARWKAWRVWRDDVRTALMAITGQKFGSAEEARAWLKANGAKLGIKKY